MRQNSSNPTAANPVKFVGSGWSDLDDTRGFQLLSNGQGKSVVLKSNLQQSKVSNQAKALLGLLSPISVQLTIAGIPHQAVYQPSKVFPC